MDGAPGTPLLERVVRWFIVDLTTIIATTTVTRQDGAPGRNVTTATIARRIVAIVRRRRRGRIRGINNNRANDYHRWCALARTRLETAGQDRRAGGWRRLLREAAYRHRDRFCYRRFKYGCRWLDVGYLELAEYVAPYACSGCRDAGDVNGAGGHA